MKKTILAASLVASVMMITSCTTSPVCVTSSVTPLNGKNITENLGRVKGSDATFSLFGLFMLGRPDTGFAIKDALEQKGGDTLINVSVYETWGYFLFGSVNIVKVEGDAVKLGPVEAETKGKKR